VRDALTSKCYSRGALSRLQPWRASKNVPQHALPSRGFEDKLSRVLAYQFRGFSNCLPLRFFCQDNSGQKVKLNPFLNRRKRFFAILPFSMVFLSSWFNLQHSRSKYGLLWRETSESFDVLLSRWTSGKMDDIIGRRDVERVIKEGLRVRVNCPL